MSPELAVALAPCIPIAGALAVLACGRWPNLRDIVSSVATLLTFGLVVQLVPLVFDGERPAITLLQVLPGLQLAFMLEPLGMLFALVASSLWIVTSVYAVGYMRGHHEINQTRFFVFFALAIGFAIAIAFAANLFTLFLFYEALTLSTFPLVTHRGTDEARRAGRVYLGILLSTSIGLLLLAIVWTWRLTGTLDFRPGGILAGHAEPATIAILLALFAFGTGKAALMPLHRWLPAAMVAPTPVSALLHAVAVVKAGVFTVLKIIVYIFGPATLAAHDSSLWLMIVASFTIISASVIAITRDDLKARLAYSTISQLAYIVLGAALASAAGIVGAAMHIATHAAGKITLFFCAGAIQVAAHKTKVSELDGIGRRMPWTMGAFLIASLSIIGLPPLGGAWSKWYLVLGAAQSAHAPFVGVLMLGSLLSIGYLMPVAGRAFLFAPVANDAHANDAHSAEDHHAHGEAPLLCVVPLCLTALGALALFFFAGPLHALLAPIVSLP